MPDRLFEAKAKKKKFSGRIQLKNKVIVSFRFSSFRQKRRFDYTAVFTLHLKRNIATSHIYSIILIFLTRTHTSLKVTNANNHSTIDWLAMSFSSNKKATSVYSPVWYFSTSKCSWSAFSAADLKAALIVGDGELVVHGFTLVHPALRPGGRLRRLWLALGEGQVGGNAVPHSVAQHVVAAAIRVQEISAAGGR